MRKFLVVAVAAAVALLIAMPLFLAHRVRTAEDDWEKSFGPIDALPRRLTTDGNASFHALEAWSTKIVPRDPKTSQAIDSYVYGQVETPRGLAAPNGFVRSYRTADIDRFAEWIETSEPPVWPAHFAMTGQAVPDLLQTFKLQRVLLGSAMARAAAGGTPSAERLLDASWRLNAALQQNPYLISQLVAVAVARCQLGALRKIDADPAKWLPRLHGMNFRSSMTTSLQAYVANLDASVRRNAYANPEYLQSQAAVYAAMNIRGPYNPRWLALLRTPVRWFDLPAVIDGDREMIAALAGAPRSERIDATLRAAYARGASKWSYVPDPDVPRTDVYSALRREVRLEAERELTENVLIARAAHAANGGRWPATIREVETSSLANTTWIYERSGAGVRIRTSRDIDWGLVGGHYAPLQYDLE